MDKNYFHEPNIIDYIGEKYISPIGVRKLIKIKVLKIKLSYANLNATKLIRFLTTSKNN